MSTENQLLPSSLYSWKKWDSPWMNFNMNEEQIVKLSGRLDFYSIARVIKSAILDSSTSLVIFPNSNDE